MGNNYIRDFGGVIGRLHLFSLGNQLSLFFVESMPLILVVDFGLLQFNYVFLFLCNFLLQFADLVDYFIEFLFGLQQLSANFA